MLLKLPAKPEAIIRRLLVGVDPNYGHRRIGEHGQAFEPISVEYIRKQTISVAQTYIQEGDVMWDPMVEMWVTDDGIYPLYFEMSNPPVYHRVAEVVDGKLSILDEKRYRDLVLFCLEWCGNLEQQHDF